jgi:hypothetical protein
MSREQCIATFMEGIVLGLREVLTVGVEEVVWEKNV